MFFKIGVLKNFAIFAGFSRSTILFKETPAQVFSCEYCDIFKNTSFEEHTPTAASVLLIIK